MPCDSKHLEASGYEKEISRVACFIDELAGKKWTRAEFEGYHPKVYSKCSRNLGDRLTRQLCSALRKVDVTKYSLELQIWWRDHQAADEERRRRDEKVLQDDADIKAALEKLTPRERKLLGWGPK